MDFEEKTKIDGIPAAQYFAFRLAEFEKKDLDIERSKLEIGYLRQVNNAHKNLLVALLHGV